MQKTSDRSVMFFGNKGISEPVLNCIRSSGWDVSFSQDVDDACRLILDKNIYVGLAELGDANDESGIQPIEELVSRSHHVKWLGILPRDNLESARVKQVISHSFYDYHTLPYEPQLLLSSLGHAYGMAKMHMDEATLSQLDNLEYSEDEMVGASPQLQAIFSAIRKVAVHLHQAHLLPLTVVRFLQH